VVSLLCPSRRPESLRRLYESAVATANTDQWELCVYVDWADAGIQWNWLTGTPHLRYVVGPQQVLSNYWNCLARWAAGDIMGMLGDDVVMQSQGWDTLLERMFAEYPDRILFAFGWDGFRNETHGSHGFVSREWVNALGRFTTPGFSHDYADTWMNDVARAVNRWRYLPALVTAHHHHEHPSLGVEFDHVYCEGVERGQRDNCAARFNSPEWTAEIQEYANKLRAVMS